MVTEIAQMNQNLHSAHNGIRKAQDAVSAVEARVTGHDDQLIFAKNAVDKSQADISQMDHKVQSTHNSLLVVQGALDNMQGSVTSVQDEIVKVKDVVTYQDSKLNQASAHITQLDQ